MQSDMRLFPDFPLRLWYQLIHPLLPILNHTLCLSSLPLPLNSLLSHSQPLNHLLLAPSAFLIFPEVALH